MGNAVRATGIFLIGLFLGALGTMVLRPAPSDGADVAVDMSHHHIAMHDCIEGVLKTLAPSDVNAGLYTRVWRLCGNQIFNGLYLDDFLIRRQKFIQQDLDERVTLWLVVAITASGVILAALQLFMSFRLASDGRLDFMKDSQLAVETGKISLKSSITGLLILALSLAFFMIYVVYIYQIHEIPLSRPSNLQTPTEIENIDPPTAAPSTPSDTGSPPAKVKEMKTKK